MDLQKLVDAMGEAAMRSRADYHVTLGGMIEALEKADADAPVYLLVDGEQRFPGKARSYRGYYSDLAFEPIDEPRTASEFLAQCRVALGNTYEGYKGGDFLMTGDTPLWISTYGSASGIAIIGIDERGSEVFLVTKQID